MDISIAIVGIIILIAALIGGNVKGGGISIPPLRNTFVRVIVGLLGAFLFLIMQAQKTDEYFTYIVECSETEYCDGIPIACKVSNENPKETLVGNVWVYKLGTDEAQNKNLNTSSLRFGHWKNPQCGINEVQHGWNAGIGTCGTGRGDGIQRCVAVKVKQSFLERWF